MRSVSDQISDTSTCWTSLSNSRSPRDLAVTSESVYARRATAHMLAARAYAALDSDPGNAILAEQARHAEATISRLTIPGQVA